MNLYFIRHADALPEDNEKITNDFDRPLSAEGRKQCGEIATSLKNMGVKLDLLLVSPLVRAQQTAEEMLKPLGQKGLEITTHDMLAPDVKSKPLMKEIRNLDAENVALIGHNPDLRHHIAYLTNSDPELFSFGKAGMALVECSISPRKGTGTLVWLVTPGWKFAKGG